MATDWWGVGIGAFALIFCAILGIADQRHARAQERLHTRLDDNDATTREQDMRIATLEEHIRHLPTAESIGRLHEKVNEVGIQVANVKGGQDVLTELLSRLLGNGEQQQAPQKGRR